MKMQLPDQMDLIRADVQVHGEPNQSCPGLKSGLPSKFLDGRWTPIQENHLNSKDCMLCHYLFSVPLAIDRDFYLWLELFLACRR